MTWTRARDWLIGAAGMVVLVLIAGSILWWIVSEPADAGSAGPVPSEPSSSSPDGGAGAPAPPADLSDDEVWFGDLRLDAGTVLASSSMLTDVRAVGRDVVTGPDGLVVAADLGGGAEVRPAEDGQATVVRTVEALGRDLRVTATGTVDVEDGRLVLEPRSIDVGGPDFLSGAIATIVRNSVSLEHEIEGLPEGLVLEDVVVRDDGFRAALIGEDVLLRP
ncbi:LmeA family phospholipid-binding protein [Arthrobacter sp. CP30]